MSAKIETPLAEQIIEFPADSEGYDFETEEFDARGYIEFHLHAKFDKWTEPFYGRWHVVATIDGVEATCLPEVGRTTLRMWDDYRGKPEVVSAQFRVWGPSIRIKGNISSLNGSGKVTAKIILYLKKTEQ